MLFVGLLYWLVDCVYFCVLGTEPRALRVITVLYHPAVFSAQHCLSEETKASLYMLGANLRDCGA